MKVKRTLLRVKAVLAACLLCMFPLVGCDGAEGYAEQQMNGVRSDILRSIDWFKDYYDLESGGDISMLPAVVDSPYAVSGKAVASNALRVVTIAKHLGVSADYDAYYDKLVSGFELIYCGTEAAVPQEDIEYAYLTTMNVVIRFLHAIGKDATDFCGFDLEEMFVYGNTEKANVDFEEIDLSLTNPYELSYRLTTLKNTTPPQTALYTFENLVWLLGELQTEGGYWGYDMDTWEYAGDIVCDTDFVAVAICALSGVETDAAADILNKAKTALLTMKNDDGTYKNPSADISSSSTALALSAWARVEGGVFSAAVENKTDPLAALKLFKNTDNGFAATLTYGDATEGEGDEVNVGGFNLVSKPVSDEISTADAIDAMYNAYLYYKSFTK